MSDMDKFVKERIKEVVFAKEDYKNTVSRLKERVEKLTAGNNLALFSIDDLIKEAKDKWQIYSERDYYLCLFCSALGPEYKNMYWEKCRDEGDEGEEEQDETGEK